MQSFKLILTIAVLFVSVSAVWASERKDTPQPLAHVPAAKVIGYSWPYADRDIVKDLGSAPIVVELFTAQGCIFCPSAEDFFADLMEKDPAVIGLACPVTFRDVNKGSLSLLACTNRQKEYLMQFQTGGAVTPHFIIGGHTAVVNTRYEDIYAALKKTAANPPGLIGIKDDGNHIYTLTFPVLNKLEEEHSRLTVIQYQKPMDRVIAGGPNQGVPRHFVRVVASIRPVASWKADVKTLSVEIPPDENTAGAVVILQGDHGIMAVGETQF